MSKPIVEPAFPRTQNRQGYDLRQLYRRPPPTATVPPTTHFCLMDGVASQTISTGTSWTTVELSKLYTTDTDYFVASGASSSDPPYSVHCLKKGLYYAEFRTFEPVPTGIGSHENRGYPRDLSIDFPNGQPNLLVKVPGGGWPDNLGEAAESSFVGWKAGVNASATPGLIGIGTRELICAYRIWFSLNDDNAGGSSDFVLSWAYRQETGFDQHIATCRGFAMHVPSDADLLEFSQWTEQTY